MTAAPPPPLVRLSLGITGHRESNPAFAAHREATEAVLADVFSRIDAQVAAESPALGPIAPTRLHNLLASGVDQLSAESALKRGWELVAPLPFGRALNLAINALPHTAEDGAALLRGEAPADVEIAERAATIRQSYRAARLFELADQDATIERLFREKLANPADRNHLEMFNAHTSERVAVAGRVMIEQSDFLIAVWDGASRSQVGGTGHTIAAALELGTPVVWIDPARASEWRILGTPESLLVSGGGEDREAVLAGLVSGALRPAYDENAGEGGAPRAGAEALAAEAWHPRSNWWWTQYRRIEAMFGGGGRPLRSLVQVYETPDEIGSSTGTMAPLMAEARVLTADDPPFAPSLDTEVLRRFAWADGISARLSDYYRGGMVANFIVAALAVGAGLAYQPIGGTGTTGPSR